MTDVRYLQQLQFPAYAVTLDWLMTPQRLLAEGLDLQTAVIIALGTDALADVSDELPDPTSDDRRGWWGDMDAEEIWNGWPVGCKLWLLARTKITGVFARQGSTIARAEGYTRDALQPFVTQLIASQFTAVAIQTDTQRIDVGVEIYRGPRQSIALRYADLWDELGRN